MTDDPRELAAGAFEEAARELDAASGHLLATARHFREGEIPRGCAHAYAAEGHMLVARQIVEARAVQHARRSVPE